MNKIAIIALEYLEPEYQQTLDCLKATGHIVFKANRDGVGNMSRAFNDAFKNYVLGNGFDFVWFVTNVTFQPDVARVLAKALTDDTSIGAIHPAMQSSDHLHLRSYGTEAIRIVPFIEFTAPMFRVDVFSMMMLDENLWYYYFDLLISYRLKEAGYSVGVHNNCEVQHTYLRNARTTHPISAIRKQLRDLMTKPNQEYLREKYGADWRSLFNWKG